MMASMCKYHIFGNVRCHMYFIEWQKRGLPHAHILIWLIDRIRPDRIDTIISAESPDPDHEKVLYDIVCKNMIHGPCGQLNPRCVCMVDKVCSKKYPKSFLKETITEVDGYPT